MRDDSAVIGRVTNDADLSQSGEIGTAKVHTKSAPSQNQSGQVTAVTVEMHNSGNQTVENLR